MGILNVLPPALLKTKLFEGLDQVELKALVNKGTIKNFQIGDTLIVENQTGDEFYCITKGSVEILVANTAGAATLINTLGEGDVVGEMILVKKNTRTASALAKKECEVIVWKHKDCLDLFSINPQLGYKIMRNLGYLLSNKLTDMNALYKK